MNVHRQASRGPSAFWTVLVLLAVLTLMIWINGACHAPPGRSRIDWPDQTSLKP